MELELSSAIITKVHKELVDMELIEGKRQGMNQVYNDIYKELRNYRIRNN